MANLEQEPKPNTDKITGKAIAKLIAIQREGGIDRSDAIRRVVRINRNPKLIELILKGGV